MTLRTHMRAGLKVQPANKARFHGVESVEFQPVVPPFVSRSSNYEFHAPLPSRRASLARVRR